MRYIGSLLWIALPSAIVFAGEEQDRFEEQTMARCAHQKADRSLRTERGERANTIRDLEAAFPGKLPKAEPGKTDEAAAWFKLVAGNDDEWRKTDAVAAGLGPMFERWRQRLDLGPAPSIKRDEFMRFSKQIINFAANAGDGPVETDSAADKVFRILDLNSDDELTGAELSSGLGAQKARVDSNGNGRISKEEYREYFRNQVEAKAEKLATAIKTNQSLLRDLEGSGKRGTGLPNWFTTLDEDKDKQISLFEWRKAGRASAEYQEMDLNADGLLTADEYLRWTKLRAEEDERQKREKK